MADKTIRLYDDRPYGTDFTASVISAEQTDKGVALVLDRTLFFPEEGGQYPDRGTINGHEVLDVQISREVITHTVQADIAAFPAGASVKGRIDWAFRFSNMQNHSGEHILSGLIYRTYGYPNVGFHLSPDIVTVDVGGFLDADQLADIELRVNRVIWSNVPITAEYPDPEVLKDLQYRSKKEIEGAVRIVTVEGVDVCACCAPHVRKTGEIGLFKILKAIRYKGGVRLTIACGERAFREVSAYQEVSDACAHLLSETREGTVDALKRVMAERDQAQFDLKRVQADHMRYVAASLPADAGPAFLFAEELDPLVQRDTVNDLVGSREGISAVFVGSDKAGYRFIAGSRTGDAREFASFVRERFGARGGGKPAMVQGSVSASREELEQALRERFS